MERFDPQDLRPGDVLLHSGKDDISKLIAWAGGSHYSHAALVHDGQTLREASAVGVRSYALKDRLPDTTHYAFIDVYRRPNGLSVAQANAADAVGDHYLKTPYPLSDLAWLGIVCAVRDKVVDNKWLRWMLRTVTDQLIDSEPNFMVCSELIYRCYEEAKVDPAIKVRIPVPETSALPFPDIDWVALAEEWWHDTHPHARDSADIPPQPPEVTDAELRARYAALLAKLGAKARPAVNRVPRPDDPTMFEVNPNPRTIMPSDLQHSPDYECLGRVTGA